MTTQDPEGRLEYPPYRVGQVLVGLVRRPRYTMGWIAARSPWWMPLALLAAWGVVPSGLVILLVIADRTLGPESRRSFSIDVGWDVIAGVQFAAVAAGLHLVGLVAAATVVWGVVAMFRTPVAWSRLFAVLGHAVLLPLLMLSPAFLLYLFSTWIVPTLSGWIVQTGGYLLMSYATLVLLPVAWVIAMVWSGFGVAAASGESLGRAFMAVLAGAVAGVVAAVAACVAGIVAIVAIVSDSWP